MDAVARSTQPAAVLRAADEVLATSSHRKSYKYVKDKVRSDGYLTCSTANTPDKKSCFSIAKKLLLVKAIRH